MDLQEHAEPAFLETSATIDHDHPAIRARQAELARQASNEDELIRLVFEFVRDAIRHSLDHGDEEVTYVASDVLNRGTGLCYAKSHLAAAMYRRSGIPAGFTYQRLLTDEGPVLHGLVAIQQHGSWRRLDVRGTKPNLPAEYRSTGDVLAYQGEWVEDLPEIMPCPAPGILRALSMDLPLSRIPLPSSTQ